MSSDHMLQAFQEKENAMFISGSKQGVQYLVLKRPELPNNF